MAIVKKASSIFERFSAPFPGDVIEWRPQGRVSSNGNVLALAYLQARAVMDRLDETVGPDNWRDSYFYGPNGQVVCNLSIRFGGNEAGEWITKSDGSEETQIEAVKGGISGAFKRAAVKFGIGRYLYALGDTWVKAEAKGNYINFLEAPLLPKSALPKDVDYEAYVADQKKRHGTQSAARAAQPKREPQAPTVEAPPADTPAPGAPASHDTHMARALGYKVPKPLPLAGKTYEECLNTDLGQKLLLYLARHQPNNAGDMFSPTAEQEAQHHAAIFIVGNTPSLMTLSEQMTAAREEG